MYHYKWGQKGRVDKLGIKELPKILLLSTVISGIICLILKLIL